MPPRLYRHPSEIQSDIEEISTSICAVEEMFSIREILTVLASALGSSDRDGWYESLDRAISDAAASMDRLKELRSMLRELSEEMKNAGA